MCPEIRYFQEPGKARFQALNNLIADFLDTADRRIIRGGLCRL